MKKTSLSLGGILLLLITACFFACQNDVFVESELIAESRESCPIPECDVQIIKTESPGGKCCGFEIRAINMTDCALVFTVEERDGIQSIMVPIGGTYTHYLKLCDYNSSTIRFYNAQGVCFEETIDCFRQSDDIEEEEEEEEEEDCVCDCSGIELSQVYRGNLTGCCMYDFFVTNNTCCEIEVLNTDKSEKQIIQPGVTHRIPIQACNGIDEKGFVKIIPSDGSEPFICESMVFSGQCD